MKIISRPPWLPSDPSFPSLFPDLHCATKILIYANFIFLTLASVRWWQSGIFQWETLVINWKTDDRIQDIALTLPAFKGSLAKAASSCASSSHWKSLLCACSSCPRAPGTLPLLSSSLAFGLQWLAKHNNLWWKYGESQSVSDISSQLYE